MRHEAPPSHGTGGPPSTHVSDSHREHVHDDVDAQVIRSWHWLVDADAVHVEAPLQTS